jgi:heptosyltransferase-1
MQRALIDVLRYFASQRKVENFIQSTINTIAVVELARLGDVLAMLPSLARLQALFPDAGIQVLVDRRYTSLLGSFGTRFKFIGVRNPQTVLGLVQALRMVRGLSADLAISMSSPRRNAIVTLASSTRFKLGYLGHVDSLTPFLLSTPVEALGFELPAPAVYSHENIYERPEKIFTALGAGAKQSHRSMDIKPDVYEAVLDRLAAQGVIPENRYVVLHPFSGWKYRNWDLANYVSLANKIIDEVRYEVVISCEKNDAGKVRRALPSESTIRVAAAFDLLEVAVLMKGATLIVCSDSGPLHLAAALDVKSVGLFGPAPPELTAPLCNQLVYLYKKVECSPCDQRVCIRRDRPCMELHQVDEVFAAVARMLGLQSVETSIAANG